MRKISFIIILLTSGLIFISSCRKDFLDVKPAGGLEQYLLENENGINALLVGAYSMLDGVSGYYFGWESASSNWLFGSIRGMEANKGTDSGDSGDWTSLMTYMEEPTNSYLNIKWREIYDAVSRCNRVIAVTNQALKAGNIDQTKADLFINQARVLRGWYHFEAWRMWKMIPYMDENTNPVTVRNIDDVSPQIIADLTVGTSLPINMGAVGKFNKTVAQVILGKAMMQMNHDYAGALPILIDARDNGAKADGKLIGLAPTYGEIFDIVNRNDIESIYTVQYSVNDGSGGWNGGYGEVLNFPYKSGSSPGGCCGFFAPTQEFVNSFTTRNGLPLLNGFGYDSVANQNLRDEGIPSGTVWDANIKYGRNQTVTRYAPGFPFIDRVYICNLTDTSHISGEDPITGSDWTLLWVEDNSKPVDPRLDWSAGRRGIPYWDWGIHTGTDWIRDQTYSGPYSPKKQVYKKSQEGYYTEVGNWTSGWTANGYRMIRYADLLLLIAECQIETGDLAGSRNNINLVRARAANPAGFVVESDGTTPAANYVISIYPGGGVYPFDNQDNARQALYLERKLELGQEGHRYFDLNRWGITVSELNRALAYEKTMKWGLNLYGNATVGPEDTTYPIPQRQIEISSGKIVQNR
jgi:hypothetical protein